MERKYFTVLDFADRPVYRPYYDCDEVDAEIERLRADLVWSVREDCRLVGRYVWQVASGYIECDGTPESICRAVREARDGVS